MLVSSMKPCWRVRLAMRDAPRIALLSDARGWHEARLKRAFFRRGVRPVFVSLRACRLDPRAPLGLHLPGFTDRLPEAVFVRAIPGGSFEQVTLRLDVLHALAECGTLVYNPARAIERTVDKAMTSLLLHRARVATPPTWACESPAQARQRLRRETAAGHKLVLKPLFGSRGRGLQLLSSTAELPPPEAVDGVYYLQRYVPGTDTFGRDWRVMVVGGRAVAAMERRSEHWITNRAQGGLCLPCPLTAEFAAPAEAATAAVGASYAGVDLIRHRDGALQVLEVNGIPAWSGLQTVTPVDIAQTLVDDLLARLPQRHLEAVS